MVHQLLQDFCVRELLTSFRVNVFNPEVFCFKFDVNPKHHFAVKTTLPPQQVNMEIRIVQLTSCAFHVSSSHLQLFWRCCNTLILYQECGARCAIPDISTVKTFLAVKFATRQLEAQFCHFKPWRGVGVDTPPAEQAPPYTHRGTITDDWTSDITRIETTLW